MHCSSNIYTVIDGSFVDPMALMELNLERMKRKRQFLVPKVSTYKQDKGDLSVLRRHAESAFRYRVDLFNRILSELDDPKREKGVDELCEMINGALLGRDVEDEALIQSTNADVGQWVADYLADNGYNPHTNSTVIKQMVLTAFPTVTQEGEYRPETLKDVLLRSAQVMNEYLDVQERHKYSWSKLLGNGGKPTFYS